ncbi:MAG: aldo/keto reductase, partial [Chloroflexota bacterium]
KRRGRSARRGGGPNRPPPLLPSHYPLACAARSSTISAHLAWLVQKTPVTAPTVGATKIRHLDDAVGALSVTLTQDEVAYLEEPYVPNPIVG